MEETAGLLTAHSLGAADRGTLLRYARDIWFIGNVH